MYEDIVVGLLAYIAIMLTWVFIRLTLGEVVKRR